MAAVSSTAPTFNIAFDDEDENEAETDLPDYFQAAKPAIVFCVDGRKRMVETQDGEVLPITMALQCVRQVIRNHIFASVKCFCGLVIVGCKETKNAIGLKHIVTVSPLKYIGADIVKEIDNLLLSIEEGKYEDSFGYGNLSLSDALWCAINIHSQMKAKVKKKIVIFSNDDDPLKDNRLERVRTIAKVADFEKAKMELQLISIGESFDFGKCYKELLELSGDWDANESPCSSLEAMVAKCKTAKHRHVSLANIPLYLSDDFFIDVSVNYLAKAVKNPFSIKLSKATNEPVTSRVKSYNVSTGEVVQPMNIYQCEEFGGRQILFKPEEVMKINSLGERRLKLLGFKPRSTISLELHVKPSAFVYPSEALAKGGSTVFTALLQRCHKRNVVPICTFCPRPTSTVRFVALVPQLEERVDSRQIIPPGFILVFLPFGDEVRDWDDFCTNKLRANPEQVDLMKQVVKKLRFKYDPDNFPCPKLAKHWAGMEALALELPAAEEVRDETIPDYTMIEQRLKDLPQRFRDEVYSPDYVPEQKAPRKRTAADSALDVAVVEDLAANKELDKLRLDQLKAYLKAVGHGSGLSKMKKEDLKCKIYGYLKIK